MKGKEPATTKNEVNERTIGVGSHYIPGFEKLHETMGFNYDPNYALPPTSYVNMLPMLDECARNDIATDMSFPECEYYRYLKESNESGTLLPFTTFSTPVPGHPTLSRHNSLDHFDVGEHDYYHMLATPSTSDYLQSQSYHPLQPLETSDFPDGSTPGPELPASPCGNQSRSYLYSSLVGNLTLEPYHTVAKKQYRESKISKSERRSKKKEMEHDPYRTPQNASISSPQHTENPNLKRCSNCCSTNSPSWRRDNDGKLLLCNACGLYQKLHNKPRPWYIAKDGTVKVLRPTTSHQKCWNCGVTETPLWRRNDAGKIVCNACGLFLKQTKGNRKVTKKSLSPT